MKPMTLLPTLCALLLLPVLAWAASGEVGAAEVEFLNNVFTGNLGFIVGLVVVTIGIYNIARGNLAGGITLVVLGVLVTLTPAFFNVMRALFCPIAGALWGANCPGVS